MLNDKIYLQELPLILVGFICLLGSTGSQTAAPFFFGLVVDAALKSMGLSFSYSDVQILHRRK